MNWSSQLSSCTSVGTLTISRMSLIESVVSGSLIHSFGIPQLILIDSNVTVDPSSFILPIKISFFSDA